MGAGSTAGFGALLLLCGSAVVAADAPDISVFLEAFSTDPKPAQEALRRLEPSWRNGYAGVLLDIASLMPRPRPGPAAAPETPPAGSEDPLANRLFRPPDGGGFLSAPPRDPRAEARARVIRWLEKRTKQRFGQDLRRWRRWLRNEPYDPHPDYAAFKAALYGRIDPAMSAFFAPGAPATIRLDEIDWGGVRVNGIPPLSDPKVIPAAAAGYLGERDVVFGVVEGGEARAYPKRILGWHELARDTLGGTRLTVVYCTLCGTVIPYASSAAGRAFTFGTSGLLYRSNKLMFDEETGSLWSTSDGRPVVGSLAGASIELTALPVVTTTWREWRAAHPETTVLSLDTGHERDYSEGAAYRDYFATDDLMFEVPRPDSRLANKAEVLAVLLRPDGSGDRQALAVSVERLRREPVLHLRRAGRNLVAVTSPDGANRVFESAAVRFVRRRPDGTIEDEQGQAWTVTESALVPSGHTGAPLHRIPARRAFWFGWHAQFPDTELVR